MKNRQKAKSWTKYEKTLRRRKTVKNSSGWKMYKKLIKQVDVGN